MKRSRKIIKTALNVLIWIFVIFALAVTVLALAAQSNSDGVPAIGGKCFLSVRSDSMSPTFGKGDLIIGEMLTDEEKRTLSVGDVVTFHADLDGDGVTELNSHRIVRINYSEEGNVKSYVTKGDNPTVSVTEDKKPVAPQYVVCRWSGDSFKGVGEVLSFMQTPRGFFVSVVLPMILFFVYALYLFIAALFKLKSEAREAISAAEREQIKQSAIEEYLQKQAEIAANEENDTQKSDNND